MCDTIGIMECSICNRDGLSEAELTVHKKYYHNIVRNGQQKQKVSSGVCPDCGSSMFYEEGCVKCTTCGFSRC